MKNITRSCLAGILIFMAMETAAQVGIKADSSAADPSAGLDVNFTDKGVLLPRMTFEQRNAIPDPAEGLMVYCTNCSVAGTGVISIFQGGAWKTIDLHCEVPDSPGKGISLAGSNQIIWCWNPVPIALGYKWNTTNNWATATDMGMNLTKTETGLDTMTTYTRYVWSYNTCGNSAPDTLTLSTFGWCGGILSANHVAGSVAPVTKTALYGTATNVPGEPSKCWITSNLGADHQATAADDNTEASAGWYWQFNRRQGYKHDGTTRSPNTSWVTSISENSNWVPGNDPCSIELGDGWRLPTDTELMNIYLRAPLKTTFF